MTSLIRPSARRAALAAICLCAAGAAFSVPAGAQRKTLRTTDVWTTLAGDQRIHPRAVLNFSLEQRRSEGGDVPRQLLILGALMADIGSGLRVGVGYGNVHSSPVEELALRRKTVEHRVYEQITATHDVPGGSLNHRLRWEQRWQSAVPAAGSTRDWTYTSRLRYQWRATFPLDGKSTAATSLYIVPQSELFLRTTNHGPVLFDQDRIGVALGVGVLPRLNLEVGYLRQSQIRTDGIHQLDHTLLLQGRVQLRPRSKS